MKTLTFVKRYSQGYDRVNIKKVSPDLYRYNNLTEGVIYYYFYRFDSQLYIADKDQTESYIDLLIENEYNEPNIFDDDLKEYYNVTKAKFVRFKNRPTYNPRIIDNDI